MLFEAVFQRPRQKPLLTTHQIEIPFLLLRPWSIFHNVKDEARGGSSRMNRQQLFTEITHLLSSLQAQVVNSASNNFTDINIHAETFFQTFLSLTHGYDLENINIDEKNAAAIDLGDKEKRIAIQITSTSSFQKIKKTFNTFVDKALHQDYDRLIVLVIGDKKKYKKPELSEDGFKLNVRDDVIDIADILKTVSTLPVPDMQAVRDFLATELIPKAAASVAKEVETIMSLIELISDEDHPDVGKGFLEDPFPDKKINKRFADHSQYLKSEYQDLVEEYGQILKAAKAAMSNGPIRTRRMSRYLKTTSDQLLQNANGNPVTALEELVNHFCEKLSKNGADFDKGAVRFFVIDELIRCNVFPNAVVTHA